MTAIAKPIVPDSVKHLDADVVVEALSRHAINVSDAAGELGVASADLRRLLWANPKLTDAAAMSSATVGSRRRTRIVRCRGCGGCAAI
jgi:hypothetical protein